MAKNFTTPQGCIVAYLQMQPGGKVRIGYHCGERSEDYRRAEVSGVRGVHLPGVEMYSKDADLRFVLAPKSVRCRKTAYDSVLRCKVFNERGAELSGARDSVRSRAKHGLLTDKDRYRWLRANMRKVPGAESKLPHVLREWLYDLRKDRGGRSFPKGYIRQHRKEIDAAIRKHPL